MEKGLRINLTSIFDSKGIDNAKRSLSELERFQYIKCVGSSLTIKLPYFQNLPFQYIKCVGSSQG